MAEEALAGRGGILSELLPRRALTPLAMRIRIGKIGLENRIGK